jgi:NADH-quinone oxidoreductase subunit J
MVETIIFFLAAGVALIAALGVVLAKNPVHSALLLVSVLVAIAIIFLLQDAQLVAAVQIIVYAGAIVVLFLFVIMLLGVDRMESLQDPVRLQRPAAILLGVVALAEVLFLAGHHWATGATSSTASLHGGNDTNIQRVAKAIFTDFLWPFEVTAVLLVAAVVGGVVIARRSGAPRDPELAEEEDEDDERDGDVEADVPEEVPAT